MRVEVEVSSPALVSRNRDEEIDMRVSSTRSGEEKSSQVTVKVEHWTLLVKREDLSRIR